MVIGSRDFDINNRSYIMGILNVTPDSFSDGGKWEKLDTALNHVESMISDGADIIDVGGESTRPGHEAISQQDEMDRVLPVVEAIRERFDIPISIDTYKAAVAEAAVSVGADLINDVWGLKRDPQMAGLIARLGVPCCLMHNRNAIDYSDFFPDFLNDMREITQTAKNAGITEDKIILDPGIGFAKTYEMNLEVLRELKKVRELGFPVLLGTSRKSVIGLTLDLPSDQRIEGTIATNVIGIVAGCAFLRVHDVKEMKRALIMTEAILRKSL